MLYRARTLILLLFLSISVCGQNPVWFFASNGSINAGVYGFHPDSSAAANVAAWNSIPAGKTVLITDTGTYEINNTLWLKSNTSYIFTAGSTIKKATGSSFSHVFGNIGMLTLTTDNNIKFYGNGLRIMVNGIDAYSLTDTNISPVLRLRAQFQFQHVNNYVIDDFYINDGGTGQFLCCVVDANYGVISNLNLKGEKDGVDIISSHDVVLRDYINDTYDDAVFLGGTGYATTLTYIADVYNITVENVTLKAHTPASAGRLSRVYIGSWKEWISGNTYGQYELCLNAGNVYAKETSGSQVASIAPIHTSGNVTGADGIKWWYVQSGTIDHADVYDVIFKNITVEYGNNRIMLDLHNAYVTAGTEDKSIVNNFTVDNITFQGATYSGYLFYHACRTGIVTLKNTTFTVGTAASGFWAASTLVSGISTLDHLFIDNCILNFNTTGFLSFGAANHSYDDITVTNSDITRNAVFLSPALNCIDTAVLTFENTIFRDITRFINTPISAINDTLILNNCVFATQNEYIIANTRASNKIYYTSDGTTYIDPSGHLFYSEQAIGDVTLNITNSTGVITPAKVRSSNKVTVIQCDIPYL